MEEERKQHFERPTVKRPPSLVNLVLVALVFGFIAGVGGYLFGQAIIPAVEIPYFNIGSGNNTVNIDQPLVGIAQEYQQSVAGLYRPVQTITTVGQPLFSANDFLGSAVVVTSDGWLMTTDQVIKNNQAKVVLGDEIYSIEEIRKDEFINLVFIKIEADSLQPIDFQLTDKIKSGERLFTNIDSPNSSEHIFYTNFLTNAHYATDKYLYTDKLDYYLQILDNTSADSFLSAPYFNLDGNLMGLSYELNNQLVLLPSEYLKESVRHLLNETDRVSLGLYYIDMENNSGFERKGALVYHPTLRAVEYNSPAFKAGLKQDDQIVAVNNDIISNDSSLTSIIQNYRIGDKVIFKIFRDGVEQDIEVEL